MAASKINHKKSMCSRGNFLAHDAHTGNYFHFYILLYPYGRYGNCISEIHSGQGAVRGSEMDWPR